MESLEVTFKRINPIDKAYILGAIYRQALINEGFSADTHLYELPIGRIKREKKNVSRDLLLEIYSLNSSLPRNESSIFINEFLEKGRHYSFWYLSEYGAKTFIHLRKKTIEDISPLLNGKELKQ